MDYIYLRDLKGAEKTKWKKALELAGYDNFKELSENEPTMIPEIEFEDYARGLAYDCGIISDKNDNWPLNCIDWEEAADQLRMDYNEVEVDGKTYLFRNY